MTPEFFVLYGIPTMFLLIGSIMYLVVRLESRRYDRAAARKTKTDT
jgi:hypothetical protein